MSPVLSPISFAAKQYTTAPKISIEELCTYFAKTCRIVLVNHGGKCDRQNSNCDWQEMPVTNDNAKIIPIEPKFKAALLRFSGPIQKQAKHFGLDPTLFFAALTIGFYYKQNAIVDSWYQYFLVDPDTGNFSTKVVAMDEIEAFYSQNYFNDYWLKVAESRLANEAHRKPLFYKEIIRQIDSADTLIKYLGTALVEAASALHNQAKDWDNDPTLIVALLQHESAEQFLSSIKEAKIPMLLTPLSWFAAYHWQEFQEMSKQIPASTISNQLLQSGFLEKNFLQWTAQKNTFSLKQEKPLYARPDSCYKDSDPRKNMSENKLSNIANYTSYPKGISRSGSFRILKQAIACDNEWSLAQFSDDSVGWLKGSDIHENFRITRGSDSCSKESQQKCVEAAHKIIGAENVLNYDEHRRLLEVSLAGFPEVKEIDFSSFDRSCFDEKYRHQKMHDLEKRQAEQAAARIAAKNLERYRHDFKPYNYDLEIKKWGLVPLTAENKAWILSQVEDMRASINQRAGRDVFATNNELSPLLDWLPAWLEKCEKKCLTLPVGQFQIFFNLVKVEKLQDPSHLRRVMRDYDLDRDIKRTDDYGLLRNSWPGGNTSSLHKKRPIAVKDEREESSRLAEVDQLDLTAQQNLLRSHCNEYFIFEPRAQDIFTRLLHEQEIYKKHPLAKELKFDLDIMEELSNLCSVFSTIEKNRDKSIPLTEINLPFPSAETINIYDSHQKIEDNGAKIYHHPIGKSELTTIAKLRPDKDFLFFQFQSAIENEIYAVSASIRHANDWLKQHSDAFWSDDPPSPIIDSICKYDPSESTARIHKLLKELPCISAVLVPEEKYLMQIFFHPNEKGAWLPSASRDRVTFVMSEACQ